MGIDEMGINRSVSKEAHVAGAVSKWIMCTLKLSVFMTSSPA